MTVCVALAFARGAFAADAVLPDIEVTGKKDRALPTQSGFILNRDELSSSRISAGDTAKLLDAQPGVSLYGAGGVSSLPVLHGMADDRVRVKVDGMDLVSACANHMNPPLSYIAPGGVDRVKVMAGITPVSAGGDSIAGTIMVQSAAPEFAEGGGRLFKGEAGIFYHSNNSAQGANVSATVASDTASLHYGGSAVRAGNYKAARSFKASAAIAGSLTNAVVAGDEVGSTRYESDNQSLGFAMRRDNHMVELRLGMQNIPKQGFPNQRMDMTKNDSTRFNLRYTGQYGWGVLEARAYNEHTRHGMNFLDDKQYWYGAGNVAGMPMNTEGKNTGVQVKGSLALNERDLFRLGAEYQSYRLDDWWDPVANSAMMSPDTFRNINGGKRDRMDVFAEWEARWNPQWISRLGLRSGSVKMDTGNVQGYNTGAYAAAATAFNALNHQRTDSNLDATALVSYAPDEGRTFEAGYAVKTRSPNLYERYTWSNTNTMVMNMNNWYGDGNGYVGNINLKPEVAHTLSVSADWHDAAQEGWALKVTPYYTRVDNYIDAVSCAAAGITCPARTDGFLNLTLANQSARLYGADISGRMPLGKTDGYGDFNLSAVLNYVNGKNRTTGDNLYNIMPPNLNLAVEQRMGKWTNSVEARLVGAKTSVQATRNELRTGGYSLVNLHSSYEWDQVRFDVGVENLFNKFYTLPLGGAYLGQGATMSTGVPYGTGVPGMGRSLNVGATVKF